MLSHSLRTAASRASSARLFSTSSPALKSVVVTGAGQGMCAMPQLARVFVAYLLHV